MEMMYFSMWKIVCLILVFNNDDDELDISNYRFIFYFCMYSKILEFCVIDMVKSYVISENLIIDR